MFYNKKKIKIKRKCSDYEFTDGELTNHNPRVCVNKRNIHSSSQIKKYKSKKVQSEETYDDFSDNDSDDHF